MSELQHRLDAGGDVWIGRGVYDLDAPLVLPPRTRLRGDGADTILLCHPTLGKTQEWIVNAPGTGTDGGIAVCDLSVELASPAPEQTAIHLGTGTTIPRGSLVSGVTVSKFTRHAIKLDRCWSSVVERCNIHQTHNDACDGVAVSLMQQAHGVAVRSCYLSGNDSAVRADSFAALSLDGIVIDGGGSAASQEHIFVSSGRAFSMRGCYLEALGSAAGQYAVRLQCVRGAAVEGNHFTGCALLMWVNGCRCVRIEANNIEDTTRAVTVTDSPDTRVLVPADMRALVQGDCVTD